ncbi:MAG: hypothetical protein H0W94_01740 [Actinobacteria bacterium]|nr:hypothetical protein [Actinomycetota bacterium]
MTERVSSLGPDDVLAEGLRRLGGSLAYPTATPVAFAVMRRLEDARAGRSGAIARTLSFPMRLKRTFPVRSWRTVAAGLAAVLVLLAGLLFVSPSARDAIAGWLGLRGVRITVGSEGPPSPRDLSTLQLGELVTLAEARAAVPYRVLTPAGREPDEVYLSHRFAEGQVTLVYRPRVGLPEVRTTGVGMLLTELRGEVDREQLGKYLRTGGTTIRYLTVNGGQGYWIAGAPHLVYYLDPDGRAVADTVRVSGNVLLWEQGGLTLRLESGLTLSQALLVAESVR